MPNFNETFGQPELFIPIIYAPLFLKIINNFFHMVLSLFIYWFKRYAYAIRTHLLCYVEFVLNFHIPIRNKDESHIRICSHFLSSNLSLS